MFMQSFQRLAKGCGAPVTSLEKAQQQVALRKREVDEKLSHLRELQNQLNRLESHLKELELAVHGENGNSATRKDVRDLTKKRIELELQVANARFDHEDALERVKLAEQDLAEAERAAMVAQLTEL